MLLFSTSEDGLLAVLVDGAPERQPVSLPGNSLVGAVFTGDGFLVATSGLLPAGSVSIQAVTVTNLDRDLTFRGRHVVVAEEDLFSACFGWSGHEAILAYENRSGPRVARVSRDGAPIAPPSSMPALAAPDFSFAREPAAVVGFEGNDALLLLSTHSSESPHPKLEFARVANDGRLVWPASVLSRDPRIYPGFSVTMVPREHDAIVAWATGGFPPRIQLARIAP
jgi:hypothetical protein